jgi:hypothetical protein
MRLLTILHCLYQHKEFVYGTRGFLSTMAGRAIRALRPLKGSRGSGLKPAAQRRRCVKDATCCIGQCNTGEAIEPGFAAT